MRLDVGWHSKAAETLEAVLRSLSKPNKLGFAGMLRDSIRRDRVRLPSGELTAIYDVDGPRIGRVLRRIVEGLYFTEWNRPVRGYASLQVTLAELAPTSVTQSREMQMLLAQPKREFGEGVFGYRQFRPVADEPHSMWYLEFYGGLPAIAITGSHHEESTVV